MPDDMTAFPMFVLLQGDGAGTGALPSAPPRSTGNGGGEAAPLGPATGADGTTTQPGGGGGNAAAPSSSPFGGQFIFILFGVLIFMMIMSIFAGRKEKKRRAEMLSSLRRHDRVVTNGGIIGTIVEIKDKELVLKIDENTNTRMRVLRDAVGSVLKQGPESHEDDGVEDDVMTPA
jgi:preprotein translocase subunit YajC